MRLFAVFCLTLSSCQAIVLGRTDLCTSTNCVCNSTTVSCINGLSDVMGFRYVFLGTLNVDTLLLGLPRPQGLVRNCDTVRLINNIVLKDCSDQEIELLSSCSVILSCVDDFTPPPQVSSTLNWSPTSSSTVATLPTKVWLSSVFVFCRLKLEQTPRLTTTGGPKVAVAYLVPTPLPTATPTTSKGRGELWGPGALERRPSTTASRATSVAERGKGGYRGGGRVRTTTTTTTGPPTLAERGKGGDRGGHRAWTTTTPTTRPPTVAERRKGGDRGGHRAWTTTTPTSRPPTVAERRKGGDRGGGRARTTTTPTSRPSTLAEWGKGGDRGGHRAWTTTTPTSRPPTVAERGKGGDRGGGRARATTTPTTGSSTLAERGKGGDRGGGRARATTTPTTGSSTLAERGKGGDRGGGRARATTTPTTGPPTLAERGKARPHSTTSRSTTIKVVKVSAEMNWSSVLKTVLGMCGVVFLLFLLYQFAHCYLTGHRVGGRPWMPSRLLNEARMSSSGQESLEMEELEEIGGQTDIEMPLTQDFMDMEAGAMGAGPSGYKGPNPSARFKCKGTQPNPSVRFKCKGTQTRKNKKRWYGASKSHKNVGTYP